MSWVTIAIASVLAIGVAGCGGDDASVSEQGADTIERPIPVGPAVERGEPTRAPIAPRARAAVVAPPSAIVAGPEKSVAP